jgi:class 3 adenylate cyclase/tetratricopeptide (TPR) repeat protein
VSLVYTAGAFERHAQAAHDAWRAEAMRQGLSVPAWAELSDTQRAYAEYLVAAANPSDSGRPADRETDWTGLARRFSGLPLVQLLEHWRERTLYADAWARHPELYHRLAKRLNRLGHLLLAQEVALEGLQHRPGPRSAAWLRHALALATARSGSPHLALERLEPIAPGDLEVSDATEEGPNLFVEVRSLQARVHKDLAFAAVEEIDRRDHLERALALYREASEAGPPYHTGAKDCFPAVNAAAVALWLGDTTEAQCLAEAARALAADELTRDPESFWSLATMGECALILRDLPTAERYYTHAVQLAGSAISDLASMRRQARLHALHLGIERSIVDTWIAIPPVIVFTGHMIDVPGRERPRFPLYAEQAVAAAIERKLDEIGAAFGFTGAAAGSDLLFIEAMRKRHIDTHVILPFARDLFVATSVANQPGDWISRFDEIVTWAEGQRLLDVLGGTPLDAGGLAFEYGNLVLLGLASLKSQELETDVVGLAVWDGESGGAGGTAATVRAWRAFESFSAEAHPTERRTRLHVEVIAPPVAAGAGTSSAQKHQERTRTEISQHDSRTPGRTRRTDTPHRIAGVLFADVVNFSAIAENSVLAFFNAFLGEVGRLIAVNSVAPLVRNTWGDGLFLVFSKVEHAGRFALDLADAMSRTPWESHELPKDLTIRVGLHAGPLFEFVDRVTGQLTLSGRHVTQAARLEPITPPGLVYATREFAALSAAYGVQSFRCESVGVVPLAKSFGEKPLYVLRRTPTYQSGA